jgi:hypothetical protein
MPRTPDRYPGTRSEEGTVYDDTVPTTQDGELRYTSGRFQLQDNVGPYDPREVLPTPTAAGALIYSDDGTTFEQVVPIASRTGILVSDDGKIVYEG